MRKHVSDDAHISCRLFQPFEVEVEEGEEPIYKHKLTTSTWTDFCARELSYVPLDAVIIERGSIRSRAKKQGMVVKFDADTFHSEQAAEEATVLVRRGLWKRVQKLGWRASPPCLRSIPSAWKT